MKSISSVMVGIAMLGATGLQASAVIIATPLGQENQTSAGFNSVFNHVGNNNIASAVYLGQGVVITAGHITPNGISNLPGGTYNAIPGSSIVLNTPNPGGGFADVRLFRISGNPTLPALPTLSISTARPAYGSPIVMAGAGYNRWAAGAPTPQFSWDLGGGFPGNPPPNWTWTEVPNGNAATDIIGFKGTNQRQKVQWGTNNTTDLQDYGFLSDRLSSGGFVTETFTAEFNITQVGTGQTLNPVTTYEAQAVGGDSGGAVFYNNGGTWELAGLMINALGYPQQPGNSANVTAVDGQVSVFADLSFYRPQILAFLPEPSGVALLLTGAMTLMRRHRL